ncbi:MAG: PHP domain-containing protein [Acutalibacteraceae bacterium]
MRYYYDLHIHSALSPCGDNDMTPHNIVGMAVLGGLDVIALTDHNACGNCAALMEVGRDNGLTVLPGMELCTAEEIHVVCLFPSLENALAFEQEVIAARPPIQNRPEIFGEQRLMNAADEVIGEEPILLLNACSITLEEVLPLARRFQGTAFPAHIDRDSYSVPAALGDIPPLGFPAAEITADGDVAALVRAYPAIDGIPLLLDSDAHYLDKIHEAGAWLDLPDKNPATLIAALDGRLPCGWGRRQ